MRMSGCIVVAINVRNTAVDCRHGLPSFNGLFFQVNQFFLSFLPPLIPETEPLALSCTGFMSKMSFLTLNQQCLNGLRF